MNGNHVRSPISTAITGVQLNGLNGNYDCSPRSVFSTTSRSDYVQTVTTIICLLVLHTQQYN